MLEQVSLICSEVLQEPDVSRTPSNAKKEVKASTRGVVNADYAAGSVYLVVVIYQIRLHYGHRIHNLLLQSPW